MAAKKAKPPEVLALTKGVQGRLLSALKRGNFIDVAVLGAGITMEEFAEVRRWGAQKGCPEGVRIEHWREAREFCRKIDAAIASVEIKATGQLQQLAGTNAGALTFLLERRFGERWGRRDKLTHEHTADFSSLSDEEIVKRLSEMGFQVSLPPAPEAAMLPPAPTKEEHG